MTQASESAQITCDGGQPSKVTNCVRPLDKNLNRSSPEDTTDSVSKKAPKRALPKLLSSTLTVVRLEGQTESLKNAKNPSNLKQLI